MVSGLFCVMFSIIAAIGISQLQFVDLNSPRNIFIMGFGLYMSLSVQDYFTSYTAKNNQGPIETGNQNFNSASSFTSHGLRARIALSHIGVTITCNGVKLGSREPTHRTCIL